MTTSPSPNLYCQACGVAVDAYLRACPLCEGHLGESIPELVAPYPEQPEPPAERRLANRHFRKVFFEVISILLCGSLVALIAIDLLINRELTWSPYTMPPIVAGWCLCGLLVFTFRWPGVLIGSSLGILAAMLIALDALRGGLLWAFPVGLPILFAASIVTGGIIVLSAHVPMSWANLAAFILLGIGLFCVVVNLVLNLYLVTPRFAAWSLPVVAAVLPVSLFLLYVHYRLSRVIDLGKIFHL